MVEELKFPLFLVDKILVNYQILNISKRNFIVHLEFQNLELPQMVDLILVVLLKF